MVRRPHILARGRGKVGLLVTARIRRMGEGNVLSLFTSGWGGGSVQPGGGGGQSSQGRGGSVQPVGGGSVQLGGRVSPAGGGVSPAEGERGWVSPAGGGEVSQDRTYYTAGSMPLAFTQEDFLV